MSKDLDKLLDKCIDQMNRGDSLEDCLRSYPEHAKELEPLLRALSAARDTSSSIPRATARLAARQRLDAALSIEAEVRRQRPRRRTIPPFGWSKARAAVPLVLLLALIGFGLYWGLTSRSAQANFTMLLSDEQNAIGDFKSLQVTISSFKVLRVGESDSWEVIKLEPTVVVDLTRLQGLNAEEVWSGKLPDGQYTKVFIEIEDATGTLSNSEIANITVPSGEMQISKPFVLPTDGPAVNFVFDMTVVATVNGPGSNNYNLLPQVNESGANQRFYKVGKGELIIRVVSGEVAPSGNVTICVMSDGNTPVPHAWVYVNDEMIGKTGADGTVSFTVSSGGAFEIKSVKGRLEGELQIDLEWESEGHGV